MSAPQVRRKPKWQKLVSGSHVAVLEDGTMLMVDRDAYGWMWSVHRDGDEVASGSERSTGHQGPLLLAAKASALAAA